MAERSKAPDSRLNTFPEYSGSGRSGLRMEAWVRIPLLTICFFFSHYLSHKNAKLQRAAGSSILNTRDSVSSIQTPRNFIVKPTSSPERLSLTLLDFKVTLLENSVKLLSSAFFVSGFQTCILYEFSPNFLMKIPSLMFL